MNLDHVRTAFSMGFPHLSVCLPQGIAGTRLEFQSYDMNLSSTSSMNKNQFNPYYIYIYLILSLTISMTKNPFPSFL